MILSYGDFRCELVDERLQVPENFAFEDESSGILDGSAGTAASPKDRFLSFVGEIIRFQCLRDLAFMVNRRY